MGRQRNFFDNLALQILLFTQTWLVEHQIAGLLLRATVLGDHLKNTVIDVKGTQGRYLTSLKHLFGCDFKLCGPLSL